MIDMDGQKETMPDNEELNEKLNQIQHTDWQDHLRTLLIALTGTVPGIGGALSVLIDKYIPERRQQRLYHFLDDLFNALKSLNDEKVDKEYLESEEFGYLLEQAIIYVSKSYQKEKIKAFRNILLNSLSDSETNQDVKEIYLHLVDELTDYDIIVLKKISGSTKVGIVSGFNEARARHEDKSEMRNAMFDLFEDAYKDAKTDWKLDLYSVILHLVSKKLLSENDLIFEHYKKINDAELPNDPNIKAGSYLYNVSEYMTGLAVGFVDYITFTGA